METRSDTVRKVLSGSVAQKCGIKKGDVILTMGGYPYVDETDLAYWEAEETFAVELMRDGVKIAVDVQKDADAPLGVVMGDCSDVLRCKNDCMFCFVRQLPKGLRETLYVKDDDYRMSFSMGSYVTLSNLSRTDIDRIKRLKLSPLYISVHCFTPELKVKICRNPQSAHLFEVLKELAAAGITMHTQIVMMEGVNDGDELALTISELAKLYPQVKTCAVVPVGLTKYREGLADIKPVSAACAAKTVEFTESFNADMLAANGEPFCWSSDEMYLIGGKELPPTDAYGDFDQIENGVGLVADFFDGAERALHSGIKIKGGYSVFTGMSFAPLLESFCAKLKETYGVDLQVCPVRNDFFGETVTVAGLITGGDIIKQYAGKLRYKKVIIPRTMLREFCGVFLDDVTVKQLEKALKAKVHISDGGESFIKILGGAK